MLKIQNTELKQELAFYKGDNKTKEKSKIDISDIGISRDITAQKEYEEKLAYQAKILSNVKDAIIVVDENNIIKYCNRALEKLFGWKKQELIGYLFFDFVQCCVDKESKRRSILALDGIRRNYNTEDKNQLNEIKCYTKDGTQIITDIYITVVRDSKGQFKGLISSIRDVSKRYEYEQKLKKSEKKYRYLFNSIDEGYAIIDVIFDKENKAEDLRYVELNKAYEKQTGLINNKIKGKTAKELKYQIEDIWYETYGMVAKTGESIRLVNKVKRLNRWFDVYIFKIDLEKCNQVGVLFKDVTEEVLYNHKLEELIKIQDELYLNVSHELKTPLNVIFSANQLMDVYLKSDSVIDKKDELINLNNNIKRNCYRLTRLINNIVDLSKSNSNLMTLNLINVNIVDVIENIVQSISEYVKSKELKIIFDTNVEENIIACDVEKIERVMLNLISNAIKFSKPNNKISVNVMSKKETVEITVKDTGTGIKKHNLDNIFKSFYQEDNSLSRNAEGNGIGLSLIKSFIELHGGSISAESEINKGSIFKFELPTRTIENQEFIEQIDSISDKIETLKIEFSDIYSI